MFPGLNPKKMKKVMNQMGIKSEEIDAEEVIIKTEDKEIIISEPQVTKVKMQGQETFQIMGEISEKTNEPFSDEDVNLVMEQSGQSEIEAREALIQTQGDIAKAILKLKESKED